MGNRLMGFAHILDSFLHRKLFWKPKLASIFRMHKQFKLSWKVFKAFLAIASTGSNLGR